MMAMVVVKDLLILLCLGYSIAFFGGVCGYLRGTEKAKILEGLQPPFQVGDEVRDDLTRTECKVIGVSYMNGHCGNPLEDNCGCWGIWIDSDYCDGGRHPWELSKIE